MEEPVAELREVARGFAAPPGPVSNEIIEERASNRGEVSYPLRMSVTNQRATCPGPLIEERPGVGECARGDACEVLEVKPDYLAYRNAHMRVTSVWQDRPKDD